MYFPWGRVSLPWMCQSCETPVDPEPEEKEEGEALFKPASTKEKEPPTGGGGVVEEGEGVGVGGRDGVVKEREVERAVPPALVEMTR